jgi:hypothetical protein
MLRMQQNHMEATHGGANEIRKFLTSKVGLRTPIALRAKN